MNANSRGLDRLFEEIVGAARGHTSSYKGHDAGEYLADIVVGDRLVVELKCADRLLPVNFPHL